ncbi:hypothetical protein ACFV2X_18975 [Streptomyces sp. NPDC059679]|uniref:hypothetical protein n=1 Tax=Streptomyces sp. NPDC059679 TaxID=3346903 RepID=UPI0036C9B277
MASATGGASEARQHAWRIESREYARHEQRRGRRFAFTHLDPARTALVVVDMVPFFVSRNPYCRGIVPNITRLADTLRAAGGTVAWVLPEVRERSAVAEEFHGPEAAKTYRTGTDPFPPAAPLDGMLRPPSAGIVSRLRRKAASSGKGRGRHRFRRRRAQWVVTGRHRSAGRRVVARSGGRRSGWALPHPS